MYVCAGGSLSFEVNFQFSNWSPDFHCIFKMTKYMQPVLKMQTAQ